MLTKVFRNSIQATLLVFALIFSSFASAREININPEGLDGSLSGTYLEHPSKNAPTVLIIPGSGPTDQNGNSPLGVKSATYQLLAEALLQKGVSSVRIDKRGLFKSSGAIADPNKVTIADYVTDTHNWVKELRVITGHTCIWLAGHSEGALVVAAAAANNSADICGVILLASPGRPAGEVLRDQLRKNIADQQTLSDADRAISLLSSGCLVDEDSLNPAIRPLFGAHIQKFLISLFSFDPAKTLSRVRRPILVIHGIEDIQISSADISLLEAANPKARIVKFEGVNHVLKPVEKGNKLSNLASYGNPNLPLAPGIDDAIVQFLLDNSKIEN